MNKKSLLGLILFAGIIISGMFFTTQIIISQSKQTDIGMKQDRLINKDGLKQAASNQNKSIGADTGNVAATTPTKVPSTLDATEKQMPGLAADTTADSLSQEPWPSIESNNANVVEDTLTADKPQLILDSKQVDYQSYIPKMQYDKELKEALTISNPDIDIDADAAVLFDADTKQVLYYKNPVQAVFPASTLKLLTSIVALNYCEEEEQVTIGDEITMIASDSTRAYLKKGQKLTIRNLLEGMLLPSGNDAAYAVAAYVGRKSLKDLRASKELAISEFIRLMNEQAKEIGVKNSCFKTPDGYDAIGQYTTAYDMGLIGIAATQYDTIVEIAEKSASRNIFVSGEDITWKNTNKLITKYSGQYFSPAIGLKTGTSTMAGRCLVSAARLDGKEVVCAIMDSTSAGRWEDAIALMKYGLD